MNFKKESIHLVFNDRIKPNLHALHIYIYQELQLC